MIKKYFLAFFCAVILSAIFISMIGQIINYFY
jgi:hypothetical protein